MDFQELRKPEYQVETIILVTKSENKTISEYLTKFKKVVPIKTLTTKILYHYYVSIYVCCLKKCEQILKPGKEILTDDHCKIFSQYFLISNGSNNLLMVLQCVTLTTHLFWCQEKE